MVLERRKKVPAARRPCGSRRSSGGGGCGANAVRPSDVEALGGGLEVVCALGGEQSWRKGKNHGGGPRQERRRVLCGVRRRLCGFD